MDASDRRARMMRQLDVAHPDKLAAVPVTLVGAGGIGSFVGQYLAKMGLRSITVYDPDTVEEHNVPNQLYGFDTLGQPKVKALAAELERMGDDELEVVTHQEYVDGDTKLSGLVISMVDSMPARQAIWSSVRMNMDVSLFIDARMGAELGQIRVVRPVKKDDIAAFEKSMEGEVVELPCTARAVIYNGAGLASLICNVVKRHAVGEPVPAELVLSFPDIENGTLGFVSTETPKNV